MAENVPQLNIVERGGYILVTFPPYESRRQLEAGLSAVYDAVEEHGCCKLLMDCRATRERIPILDLFHICLYLVDRFGSVGARMAVIASPEAVYPDRFGETVVRNRGLDLIRFTGDDREALDWLLNAKGPPS